MMRWSDRLADHLILAAWRWPRLQFALSWLAVLVLLPGVERRWQEGERQRRGE